MKVEAKEKCPVCRKLTKLISFRIQAGKGSCELVFYCDNCNLRLEAQAAHYRIDRTTNTVIFSGITNLDLGWDKEGKYNPSERN